MSHSLLWYQYVIVFCMNEWGPAFTLYCVTFYLEWHVHRVEGNRDAIPFVLARHSELNHDIFMYSMSLSNSNSIRLWT